MKRLAFFLIVAAAAPAQAWEAESTHAGLTEGAALGSGLHATLTGSLGRKLGLYEPLAVPPDQAPALLAKLKVIEPSSGLTPDTRGSQSALAWLVAGSVVEDLPAERGRNHFYDPVHKTGLTGRGPRGLGPAFDVKLWASLSSASAGTGRHGVAAPDWIVAKDNDLGLARFWDELERSATAPTAAERDQHLAFALLCAGAMTHVLEDVGSPSRARDDLAAHLTPLGGGPADRGSRFERLAALVYGRLGVPTSRTAVRRAHARDYFTSADAAQPGLADWTAAHFYSLGTLPEELVVEGRPPRGQLAQRVTETQRFPSPRPAADPNMTVAVQLGGGALRGDGGICLANYRLTGARLSWYISDDCAADQLGAILPQVSAYATGFLDWLFRGSLRLDVDDAGVAVRSTGARLARGQVVLLGEDASGKRTAIAQSAFSGGELVARFPVPSPAPARLFAVFRGSDEAGEDVVAVGSH